MVQVIDLENQKGQLQEALGMSLGKGLGSALNNYFANRSLNSVLQDKALESASPSERLEAVVSALSPYGETGQKILHQRLAIEQQAQSERKGKAMGRYFKGEDLTPEEQALFSPAEFAAIHKAKNPPQKVPVSERPVPQEQIDAMKKAHAVPGYNQMSESEKYQTLVDNGVSAQNAIKEATLAGQQSQRMGQAVDTAYKQQKDFIDDVTRKHVGFETEMKPRLLQMQAMKSEDLISPTAAVFLEKVGIPLGALEDPSSELYQKLSQDLLKGLPETYGNRILKVEVDNFLKTIPTLMNSPDGRRMIASNMLKLGEMKDVYYNAMRAKQQAYNAEGKPLPSDFEQEVFDQVKPQIDRINSEFIKMAEITSVPEGTVPFFEPGSTQIRFVPKDKIEWATKQGGRRIW